MPPMTPEQLAWVSEQTRSACERSARNAVRRYRNQALAGFFILLLGIGWAVKDQHDQSYKARGVLCQIISQGDQQAYSYVTDGTITKVQLDRALKASAHYRELLSPGKGCTTSITPAPQTQPAPAPATPPEPGGG